MGRKVLPAFLICVVLLLATTQTVAAAPSVYTDGNISSTYTDIFRDTLNNISIKDDYVFFRSGEREYTLIYGDLELTSGIFYADEYEYIELSYEQQNFSTSRYYYSTGIGESLALSTQATLVYSNLGNYPTLIQRGAIYEFTELTTIIIIGICLLLRSVFKFTYSKRI